MKKIGIIGLGNMGASIAQQLKDDYRIYAFDKDSAKITQAEGVEAVSTVEGLADKADTIILAVKPQDFDGLLEEIKPVIKNKLIVSIAAGIPAEFIERALGVVRVVRVMPNMPARIGQGISCLCKGRFASEEDFDLAQEIFVYLGETLVIEERLMNAATAISGSGPGFCYDLIEAKNIDAKDIKKLREFVNGEFIPSLTQAAQAVGFTQDEAVLLAACTGNGSIALLERLKLLPSDLKKQIASKGGTTEVGLEVLRKGLSLEEAVKAAMKRAEELSKRS